MQVRTVIVAGCLLTGAVVPGAVAAPDSSESAADNPAAETSVAVDDSARVRRVRNPVLAGALSLAAPGAGQFYNRQFVKGIAYIAVETGLVFYARNRLNAAEKYADEVTRCNDLIEHAGSDIYRLDSSRVIDSAGDTALVIDTIRMATLYRMSADTARYKRDERRTAGYQAAWWAATCYLYAFFDALEKTGYFAVTPTKNPALAGWLSAVPGLGLGQIYNGRLSKAGMIFMVQTSLAVMAYNNHRLLQRCEEALRTVENRRAPEYAVDLAGGRQFSREWDVLRRDAFRTRNTYLWYSIFFYLYGIFDAVVDAHLHDLPSRMRLEPDLQVSSRHVGMHVVLDVPGSRKRIHTREERQMQEAHACRSR